MSLIIPDEILHATHMTEAELRQEMAVWLYAEEKLTSGQASKFAGMSIPQFLALLKEKSIQPHYGVEDFNEDMATLENLRKSN